MMTCSDQDLPFAIFSQAKKAQDKDAYAVVFMRNSSEFDLPPPYSRVYGKT